MIPEEIADESTDHAAADPGTGPGAAVPRAGADGHSRRGSADDDAEERRRPLARGLVLARGCAARHDEQRQGQRSEPGDAVAP